MKGIIWRGAEAVLMVEDGVLLKERVAKRYRLPELDERLRTLRTRSEGKLLQKLEGFVPRVFSVDEERKTIQMEFLDGSLVRDVLDGKDKEEREKLLRFIGSTVGLFHQQHIIHGDLTTSNMIEKDHRVFFLDFGLGFLSVKAEDKAVDLHVFRQALESTHFQHAKEDFAHFLEGYRTWNGSGEVLKRLERVEQRGRYKRKVL